MKNWISTYAREISNKYNSKYITILGLAYKKGTHSIKNSPAINLIKKLNNYKLKVFDPIVQANFRKKKFKKFAKMWRMQSEIQI